MITFCCIFRDQDGEFLTGMLQSLPKGSQVVLMRCVEGFFKESHIIDKVTENGLDIVRIDFTYKEWSFSDARNECQKYAEREWIYFVDADERVSFDYERDLQLLKSVDSTIGGLIVNIISSVVTTSTNITVVPNQMIRVYRNHKGFVWEYSCHEQIGKSIETNGFKIGITDFIIRHLGYTADVEILQAKSLRNIKLMSKDIANDMIRPEDMTMYLKYIVNTGNEYLKTLTSIEKVKNDNAA